MAGYFSTITGLRTSFITPLLNELFALFDVLVCVANGQGVSLSYNGGSGGNYGIFILNCNPNSPGFSNVRFNGTVRFLLALPLLSI